MNPTTYTLPNDTHLKVELDTCSRVLIVKGEGSKPTESWDSAGNDKAHDHDGRGQERGDHTDHHVLLVETGEPREPLSNVKHQSVGELLALALVND